MIRALRALLAALMAAGALAASGCLPSEVSSSRPEADRITVVLGPSGGSLNPYSPLLSSRQVGELVFRGLSDVTSQGLPSPDLLAELPTRENGGLSADGRTARLRIREGVLWHDGEPVTAADVAFTLRLLTKGEMTDEPGVRYSDISSFKQVGEYGLELKLKRPNAPLVWRIVPYVLPRHLLEKEQPVASSSFWFEPVGCGPYLVGQVRPGSGADLAPVDAEGAPLTIAFTSTMKAAREAFDAAPAAVWVDGPLESGLAGESSVATQSATWNAWIFNMERGQAARDAVVRRAYMSSLPHESTQTVAASDPFGLPSRQRALMSPKNITDLLESRGWRRDKQGLMSKGGRPLKMLTLTRTILPEELEWIDAVNASMADGGIGFQTYALDYLDVGGYLDRDQLSWGDWQVARTRFYVGMPHGIAWPFEGGDRPSWENPYGANAFGIDDPELDRRFRTMLASPDPESAERAWVSLGRRLRELDVVYWESPEMTGALVKGVGGVTAHSSPAHALSAAPSWKLAPAGGE